MNIPLRLSGTLATLALAGAGPSSHALQIHATVSPIASGDFGYALLLRNDDAIDYSIISLVDAPLNDPLIGPTLAGPAEFLTSYDPGLGFLDFLEGLNPFLAGTTSGPFTFDSATGPGAGFSRFEAFSTTGDFVAGQVTFPAVPSPGGFPLVLLGLALMAARRTALSRSIAPLQAS